MNPIKHVKALFCKSIRWWMPVMLFILPALSDAQQTYPVQVYIQLIPPYTPYIPAYYTGTMPKLRVTLVNTDMQQPVARVFLRMKITSSSFSLITPPEVYTQQIELPAGMPVILSPFDLETYFRRENVRVSGWRGEFYRTQMLPDNFYRFQFEAYEIGTNRLVSNPNIGFAQAMIAAGDPPVLNQPQKGAVITESPVPNIMFSWTPRHMNSVAAAYNTEYEITLVEIYDKQANPEAAFDYSRVLYTETTKATSFIHTAAQPMLQPGMRYAWRVRAKARQGIDEISVFKNNGFSAVSWFDYAADCRTVRETAAVYENGRVNITWRDVNAMEYTAEYRKKGGNKWYSGNIAQAGLCPVYNLQFGKEYEYRIGSRCVINDVYRYSEVKGFRMPDKEERGPDCGLMPDTKITNRTPAVSLPQGLPVLAGDFPVFITKASGSGTFSGEGYVGIPYLGNLRIAVTFKNIVVNTDNQLISGYFEAKYDEKNNLIFDTDQAVTGGKGVGDIRSGEERAQYTVDFTINPDFKAKPVKEDGTANEIAEGSGHTFSKGENDKYVFILTDGDGNEHKTETDEMPATIQDKDGNTYEVDDKGNITPISRKSEIVLNDATKNKPRPDIATLVFESTPNTKYAVDQYKDVYSKVTEFFLKYKPTDEDMIASAKFMIPGASDEIFVRVVENKSLNPEKVHFVTGKGKEYSAIYDAGKNGWTLTVLGSDANDGQNLYVVQEEEPDKLATLARLNIYSYEPETVIIRLVPVNGFTNDFSADAVSQRLNEIYNKVGITCEVKMAGNFDYEPLKNSAFNVTGSGLFSTLTADMKALNNAYSQTTDYKADAITLFIIENVSGDENAAGDMPRGKQFGYLFKDATVQTIAHEVGHGVFKLEHPFDRSVTAKSFGKGDLTGNVMEYPPYDGKQFVKLQWDAIHSPGLVIGLFEKDEDAMKIKDIWCLFDFTGGIIGDSFCDKFKEIYQDLIKTKDMFAKSVKLLTDSEEWFEFEELYKPVVNKSVNKGAFVRKKGSEFDEHKIYFYKYRIGVGEQNSGAIQETVIYEEVFHAAQYLYYKHEGKEVTNMEQELEVRLAKIKENIQDSYTEKYKQNELLLKYLNAQELSSEEKEDVHKTIIQLGKDIFTVYKEVWKNSKWSDELINKNNPENIDFQFNFLKSLNPHIK